MEVEDSVSSESAEVWTPVVFFFFFWRFRGSILNVRGDMCRILGSLILWHRLFL